MGRQSIQLTTTQTEQVVIPTSSETTAVFVKCLSQCATEKRHRLTYKVVTVKESQQSTLKTFSIDQMGLAEIST